MVEEAETATLLYGLQATPQQGHDKIVVESDSLSLVQKLHSGRKGMAPSDLLIKDIRALAKQRLMVLANLM